MRNLSPLPLSIRPPRCAGRGARMGLFAALILCAAMPARADNELPPALQATIFKKVLGYDKTLGSGAAKVLVLAGSGDAEAAAAVVKAFQDVGLGASQSDPSRLDRELAAIKVVYLFPSSATGAVRASCARSGALTLAGDTQLVEDGKVAIALGRHDDGRPAIVINRNELHAQGHEISSDLLRLARIVQ
jgi:hypothetical protein